MFPIQNYVLTTARKGGGTAQPLSLSLKKMNKTNIMPHEGPYSKMKILPEIYEMILSSLQKKKYLKVSVPLIAFLNTEHLCAFCLKWWILHSGMIFFFSPTPSNPYLHQPKQHFKKQSSPAMSACRPALLMELVVLYSRCCNMKFQCTALLSFIPGAVNLTSQ